MNGKLYIKKFIRDDGETLSFDAEEIYLSENNTLLVRSDPATTAVEFTEEDGGEMIRQRGATYSQPVSGLIVPKSTEYWALCVRLSRFFILNHTYKIVYIKRDGSMFSMNRAWINAGLQIVPVPYENYSTWTIEFRIGDNFWTEYAEDSQGKEIYSNTVELPLLTAGTGGEVWSDATQQILSGLGNYFTIDGTSISASINELEVRGDTYQQTYSGEQLLTKNGMATPLTDTVFWNQVATGVVSYAPLSDGWARVVQNSSGFGNIMVRNTGVEGFSTGTTYTVIFEIRKVSGAGTTFDEFKSYNIAQPASANDPWEGSTLQIIEGARWGSGTNVYVPLQDAQTPQYAVFVGTTKSSSTGYSLRTFTRGSVPIGTTLEVRATVLSGNHSSDWQNYCGENWQPYVGGVPSPSPDYPQPINVVTGEQTVTIGDGDTSQTFTVGLGSIELCKIGDYQDYIYKSGDDWYVHKEVEKVVLDGSESTWTRGSLSESVKFRFFVTISGIKTTRSESELGLVLSNKLIEITNGLQYSGTEGIRVRANGAEQLAISTYATQTMTVEDFRTWLATNNITAYYVLATATDTQITDATLVAQLNALAGAQAYNGKTVYRTNSVTMPAILSVELLQSVGGGEVWDNVGAVWEEGVGGVQTINVETTQITYPVWTVTGPCSNPTLQNDTTDTIASFDGMIASGQTLTVNFADNTAYLDSAPVAKYVSGYVSLAPGENVIGFNSDGGSTQTSTISWDNIIN